MSDDVSVPSFARFVGLMLKYNRSIVWPEAKLKKREMWKQIVEGVRSELRGLQYDNHTTRYPHHNGGPSSHQWSLEPGRVCYYRDCAELQLALEIAQEHFRKTFA